MSDSLITALNTTRSDFAKECEFARFLLDAYTGRGGFEGRIKQPPSSYWGEAAETYSRYALTADSTTEKASYLDRYEREDWPKFRKRVEVAHYLNYVAPIANLYVSYLVRKPNTRSNVPPQVEQWIRETKFDDGARLRATRATVLGWFPVVVDMPAVDPNAQTRAQAGSLMPYASELLPCHLIDYQVDDAGQFEWAKIRTSGVERDAWDSEPVRVDRVTIWTRTEFESYEVRGETAKKVSAGAHDFGEVPIAIYRSGVTVDSSLKSESPIASIAIEARRLFNLGSELDEHLRGQVFAILMIPTREGSPPAIVGSKNALAFDPEAKNAPAYLAPPASVAATYETRIEATVKEIYRMARVEYTRASGSGQSAESRKTEFEQTNLTIADLADSLADAELRQLQLVGKGLGVDEAKLAEMSVTAADSFDTDELNQELERLTSLLTVREFGRTFRSELLQRMAARVLPNMDRTTSADVMAEIVTAVDDEYRDEQLVDQSLLDSTQEDEADAEEPAPDEAAAQ